MRSKQLSLAEISEKTQVGIDECSFVLCLIELCQREELDKIILAMHSDTLDCNSDHSLLVAAIDELDDREKIAVGLMYEKELSLQDTGLILGISEGRVYQLLKHIIEKLRKTLSSTQPTYPVGDKIIQRMIHDVKSLNNLEKRILMLHCNKKVNNKDIPAVLRISDARVKQIYQVAIRKLKSKSKVPN